MRKVSKFIVFAILLGSLLLTIHVMIQANATNNQLNWTYEPPLIGENLYLSNRYTQKEDLINNSVTQSLDESDQLVTRNSAYELYLNKDTAIFKVKDIATHYIWSSAVQHVLKDDASTKYASMMMSSFVVDYYKLNTNDNTYNTDNLPKLYLQTATAPTDITNLYNSSLSTDVTIVYVPIENGMELQIAYLDEQISFTADVTLTAEGIHVNIPNESISDSSSYRIASIYVMPFLGASRVNVPGYMFIPDGSGALIRYQTEGLVSKPQQITYDFFGTNFGTTDTIYQPYKTNAYTLSAPVFGAVTGVDQYGFVGIIENGEYSSQLLVNQTGTYNVDYNWLAARFLVREDYLLYQVNRVISSELTQDDITMNYNFLTQTHANYVGMAQSYQHYLVAKGDLTQNTSSTAPLRLEILASDSINGLFGPKVITLTTTNQALDIVNDLKSSQVNDLLVVLRGWNEGGMSGNSPYPIVFQKSVGSESNFSKLISTFKNESIDTYFYNDYIVGYSGSSKVNSRTDIAKGLQRVQLQFDIPSGPVYDSCYFLNPKSSLSIANHDLHYYNEHGIDNLALDSMGYQLFSYYANGNHTRFDAESTYETLLSNLSNQEKLALYQPNSYLWAYTNNYFDMPLYSNQYTYYSDSVPFLQIVLKGYMNYYAPFSNFFSNSSEQLLQLIDYGMYPSFIVTDSLTYNLKYSNANQFYSTKYSDWKEDIVTEYHMINETLSDVTNATILNRTVLAEGIVKVDYSNQISFIINYTTTDYPYDNLTIAAQNFVEIGGND